MFLQSRVEYDKTRPSGGASMQIKNLSSSHIRRFGQILSSVPETGFSVRHMELHSGDAAEEFRSDAPVILDYVSGMSLLVIYADDAFELYYLDRLFELCPGVHFSIAALEDSCQIDCYTSESSVLLSVAEHPAVEFQSDTNSLKFNQLCTFFYQECARDFYFRGEQHEAMELVYVDRGELHNLAGGTDILLRQQELLLIGRNVWHMQYADLPVNFLTVSFRTDAASPCAALAGRRFSLTEQQVALLRQMLAENNAAEYAHDSMESLLRLLLISLLRSEQTRRSEKPKALPATSHTEQRIVDHLIQTISARSGQKLSLQQLADSAHISTTYLHRIFRTQLDMTPGVYLAKVRIEESKLLLRDGALSMGEIAKQLGFSSQQQFFRQFRAVAGMTPSEYVRTLR